MESTQIEGNLPPAQAALAALEERAKSGEKITARELVEARAEADLEIFAAEAEARAEAARKAEERAERIAELNERIDALKAEGAIAIAREKLATAIEEYGHVCVDYNNRRGQISAESHNPRNFPTSDKGEDLRMLQSKSAKIAKPYMKSTLDELARKKLAHYYGRTSWENADW